MRNGWVAINSDRWFGATDSWPGDLETYQRYLINHEVGYYLLEQGTTAVGVGQPAPVMMQQTKGLNGVRTQRLGRARAVTRETKGAQ